MKNVLLIICAVFLFGCLGCSYVKTSVTTFHEQFVVIDNESFVVVPNDEQKNSLEYKKYKQLVVDWLRAKGLINATTEQSPKYEVVINYGISGASAQTGSMPILGQTGGGVATYSGTVNSGGTFGTYSGTSYSTPTYGMVGAIPYSYNTYTRFFILVINDTTTKTRVLESTAVSSGSSNTFNEVGECVILAVFKDFPGTNGVTTNHECYDWQNTKPTKTNHGETQPTTHKSWNEHYGDDPN